MKSTYLKVEQDWNKLTKGLSKKQNSIFSMYEVSDDIEEYVDDTPVELPFPLKKKFLLLDGEWTITMRRWEDIYTEKVTDFTVGDLARIFHNHNDGSHIFLEALDVDQDKRTVDLFGGS